MRASIRLIQRRRIRNARLYNIDQAQGRRAILGAILAVPMSIPR